MEKNGMMDLIRAALWGTEPGQVSQDTYEEMRKHSIAVLPASLLPRLHIQPDLLKVWKNTILHHTFYYQKYLYAQENLPVDVPYVILKGTAAAKYYPHPEYRAMGDIDLMVYREDYPAACNCLLKHGYIESTSKEDAELGRHRGFVRNGIEVEVHVSFAMLNDPKKAQYLDEQIIRNINASHCLPDMINGLVLLEHINQHLEDGLGLRQIIDWMMFVDKCLTDREWPAFQKMVINTGLENLAVVTTRMCEMYLGLTERRWCANADEELCEKLLSYILSCGNFGKMLNGDGHIGINIVLKSRTPITFFRLLQRRGIVNWQAARRHRFLRPFAWAYQIGRYIVKGFGRKEAIVKLRREYEEGRQRDRLFDVLEVNRKGKGLMKNKGRQDQKTSGHD